MVFTTFTKNNIELCCVNIISIYIILILNINYQALSNPRGAIGGGLVAWLILIFETSL